MCLEFLSSIEWRPSRLRINQANKASSLLSETTMTEHHAHLEQRSLLVLYATETGNPLDAAERIVREARRWHFDGISTLDLHPQTHIL